MGFIQGATRTDTSLRPRFFSYSPDIWKYLDKVCETFGLRKYMRFDSEVVGCYWQEDEGEWLVKIRQKGQDGTIKDIEERCDLLLYGSGVSCLLEKIDSQCC